MSDYRSRYDAENDGGYTSSDESLRLIEVGDLHYEACAYTSALEYYVKLLDSNSGASLKPIDRMSVCYKSIDSSLRIGDLNLAESLIVQANETLSVAGDSLSEQEHAFLLVRKAALFVQKGDYENSLKISKHAFAILAITDNHNDVANLQLTMGVCHHRLGRLNKAKELYQDAASTFKRIGNEIGSAISMNNIALLQKNLCQWSEAIQLQEQAIEIAEHHGATHMLSRFQLNLGIILRKTGRIPEARLSFGNSLRLAKSLGDASRQAKNCLALGYLELKEGHLLRAEELVMEGKLIAEQAGFQRDITIADEYFGDILLARGEVEAALHNYGLGLDRIQTTGTTVTDLEGELLRRCADAHILAQDWDRAIEAANAALAVCSSCDELYELGFCHRSLGIAHSAKGDYQESDAGFIESINIFSSQNLHLEACITLNSFVKNRLNSSKQKQLYIIEKNLHEQIELFDTSHNEKIFIELQHNLAEVQLRLEKYDEALLTVAELERIVSAVGESVKSLSIADLRGRIERKMVSFSGVAGDSFNSLGDNVSAFFKGDGSVAGNLQSVLKACLERSGADAGYIAIDIPDAIGTKLRTAARDNLPGNRAADLSLWFKNSDSFTSNKSLLISSISDSESSAISSLSDEFESCAFIPVLAKGNFRGLLFMAMEKSENSAAQFNSSSLEFLSAYMGFLGLFLTEEAGRTSSIGSVPDKVESVEHFENVITGDEKMLELLSLARKVADSDLNVLLQGATGTGKGLIAYAIHVLSNRCDSRFMSINCAAIPESLMESELFGHLKGSFTGATCDKKGLVEEADGGTLFFDEINKLPLSMQGKLLQFLDNHKVRQVGSNSEKKVDIRIICASKVNLKELTEESLFLEDLYYRIADFPLDVPPLSERHNDIRLLSHHFIARFSRESGAEIPGYTPAFMDAMVSYNWPGNVRELEKCIKRALVLMRSGDMLRPEHLPVNIATRGRGVVNGDLITPLRDTLGDVERKEISRALKRTNGNKSQASRLLGISYPSLLKKIRLYGLMRH